MIIHSVVEKYNDIENKTRSDNVIGIGPMCIASGDSIHKTAVAMADFVISLVFNFIIDSLIFEQH